MYVLCESNSVNVKKGHCLSFLEPQTGVSVKLGKSLKDSEHTV